MRGVVRWVEPVVEPAFLLIAVHRGRGVVEPEVGVATHRRRLHYSLGKVGIRATNIFGFLVVT